MMIFSLVAMIGLEKCCITSACLQWLCHSGERIVARGPLVICWYGGCKFSPHTLIALLLHFLAFWDFKAYTLFMKIEFCCCGWGNPEINEYSQHVIQCIRSCYCSNDVLVIYLVKVEFCSKLLGWVGSGVPWGVQSRNIGMSTRYDIEHQITLW